MTDTFTTRTVQLGQYESRQRILVLLGLTTMLILSVLLALCTGAYPISIADIMAILSSDPSADLIHKQQILIHIRFPRVVLAILVGAVLALSGAVMQALFINPLADPGLIGVSSGAALGAVLFIVLGGGWVVALEMTHFFWLAPYLLPTSALLGGLLSVWVVYALASRRGQTDTATLLLAGIAMGTVTGALMGLLIFVADDQQLRTLTFWMMGSLSGVDWSKITVALPPLVLVLIILPCYSRALNLILLGEREARYLGVDVRLLKRVLIVLVALAVGVSVSLTGMIGFVGLVVPHLLRLAFGADHRLLLMGSVLLGATILLLADLTARTIVAPAELPIGIVTSIFGGPFFLWLLMKYRGGL